MLFRSDRKSTRLNSSHTLISYAVFCLKKKKSSRCGQDERRSSPRLADTGDLAPTARLTRLAPRSSLFFLPLPRRPLLVFFFFRKAAPPDLYIFPHPDSLPS